MPELIFPPPPPRYPTAAAIAALVKALRLPYSPHMQDWEWEVAKAADIGKYLAHYHILIDDDQRFVLMETIIQAVTDQPDAGALHHYWLQAAPLLEARFDLHAYTVWYWSVWDSDDEEECWAVTPLIRALWRRCTDASAAPHTSVAQQRLLADEQ